MAFRKFFALLLVCSAVLFAFSGCTLILIGVGVAGILANAPTETPTDAPTDAPTELLVNDPTTGYGIFIENMSDAAA